MELRGIDTNSEGISTPGLTELEHQVLEFEKQWWRYAGAKESSIKELFDLTPPAYYQLPVLDFNLASSPHLAVIFAHLVWPVWQRLLPFARV